MSDVFAPFTLPLRRQADALIVDANGKTVLVIDPDRDLEEDQAEAIADHVFGGLVAETPEGPEEALAAYFWLRTKSDDDMAEVLKAVQPTCSGVVPRGPGHCDDDAAWAQFVRQYDGQPRSLPAMSDFALANAIFMADRHDLELIHYQTAAKERIRWLSIELAKAQAALKAADAK